jgi:hypothetical protein
LSNQQVTGTRTPPSVGPPTSHRWVVC